MPATTRDRSPEINESSPLIDAANTGQNFDVEAEPLDNVLRNEAVLKSKSNLYLAILTISIGGLQIVWSVELSNGSPYLLSLGMSKAMVAFVWLAGPLTGVLVQPYIGVVSDRSRISWGRRKPFMLGGAAGTVASSLLLAYAKDIVQVIGRWSVEDQYEGWWKGLTITLATILMWCLDFSINAVQAAIRAFIVDNAPAHQQESANAWASRVTGIGNVLGYIFGYLNLPKYLHIFGNTQFKVLCTIASIAISTTVVLSCLLIKERNPQHDPPSKSDHEATGIVSFVKQTFASIRRLTPVVRSVCEIQFFHWIGWFPFLFYATTYIGQLYVNPRLRPDMTPEEVEDLWATATRVGTLALLIEAIVTLTANVLLPFLIGPSYDPLAATATDGNSISSWSSRIDQYLTKLHVPGLTLRKLWFYTQILHAICMFSTFFISTPTAGTIMIAFVGISWALSLWAPFALISADVSRRDEERRLRSARNKSETASKPHRREFDRSARDDSEAAEGLISSTARTGPTDSADTSMGQAPHGFEDEDNNKASNNHSPDSTDADEEPDRAGIILGLHNVAVSAPQILATLICSLIFKFLQKPRNEPGDVSVAWTLRLAGLSALVAAWFTWKMKEPPR